MRQDNTLKDRKQNGMGFYLFEITINIHMPDLILNIRDRVYLCQQRFGQ
jgi:hypothetical protein